MQMYKLTRALLKDSTTSQRPEPARLKRAGRFVFPRMLGKGYCPQLADTSVLLQLQIISKRIAGEGIFG